MQVNSVFRGVKTEISSCIVPHGVAQATEKRTQNIQPSNDRCSRRARGTSGGAEGGESAKAARQASTAETGEESRRKTHPRDGIPASG